MKGNGIQRKDRASDGDMLWEALDKDETSVCREVQLYKI